MANLTQVLICYTFAIQDSNFSCNLVLWYACLKVGDPTLHLDQCIINVSDIYTQVKHKTILKCIFRLDVMYCIVCKCFRHLIRYL